MNAARTCAIVLKTYAWDSFVQRQLQRLQATFPDTDIFISIDETGGFAGNIPHPNVLRTCNADMVEAGFANRFEKGSLLWWNADYTHYQVQACIPDYAYYLFVEYDACIGGNGTRLLADMIADGADFVAHPIVADLSWYWTAFHAGIYPDEQLRASLNCISFFSSRALLHLAAQRRAMSAPGAGIKFWPLGEAFVASEIEKAGFNFVPLGRYGDVTRYTWFPPILEADLVLPAGGHTFVHPVLDQKRYIASLLRQTHFVRHYFMPGSHLRRELRRFPGAVSRGRLYRAALARAAQRLHLARGGL
ncbi:hypothetical protein LV564_09560 [Komagataeibacter nataicola]|nr:hypothetical protein [Komagataeibacter nataicola]WEQ54451.1 hypothetical protein LV564_09560 [Komagataeibacter nataicola]GBR17384.1 hypothetical protein AA0616_1032 [Komagataeibacter nataicola NRIC 0616]